MLEQFSFDGFMQYIPTWTKLGLMERIVQLIVKDDNSESL